MARHLVVAGAQRCGTTYLLRVLEGHPDVATAQPARPEPKVFCDEEVVRRGREWYVQTYFGQATSEPVLAEKSTSYLDRPEAAERVAKVLGQADIVVSLRDPVARAVSNWRFSAGNGLEERPLEDALRDNLARSREWDPAATSVSPFAYLERGRYVEHLEPWWSAFPGRVHVLFFEDLTSGPDWSTPFFAGLGLRPPAHLRADRVNASDGADPALPDDLRAELRGYFSEPDRRLEERLGRALPWSAQDAATAAGRRGRT